MATDSRTTGFTEFMADMQSPDAVGRQFIDVPLAAAQQSAIGTAAEVMSLMRMLPNALVASQQRELTRLQKSADDRDPRVMALKASIEQVEVLRTTGGRGQARVQRAIETLSGGGGGNVFFGFVSDVNLAPQEGLTVRLSDAKGKGPKAFSATTEADGYFSIDLGKSASTRASAAAGPQTNLMQRIAAMFRATGQDATGAAQPTSDQQGPVGQVEILNKDKLLYSDPVPVVLENGSIYREYVIPDISSSSTSGVQDVPKTPPGTPQRTAAQPTPASKSAQPKKKK
jgi:hypothetical protein